MKQPTKYNQQPNKITLSKQRFSVIEKRIVYLVINQLECGFNVDKDLFKNMEFTIPVSQIGNINYTRIKEEAERLQSRIITFLDDNENEEFDKITPFPRIRYSKGFLYVTMFSDIVPHFMELKQGFTSYQLKAALNLNSSFSQRLYELLSRFKDTGKWYNVEIDYLKKILDVEGKYDKISMFRERVLNPAQTEIKEKTELSFTYQFIKTGRKYTHINFNIYAKKSYNLENLTEKQNKILGYLKEFGIVRKEMQSYIVHNKQKEFWKWLQIYQQNKNNIHNPAGHLIKSLKSK